jgi:hypothetical protein
VPGGACNPSGGDPEMNCSTGTNAGYT